MIIERDGDHYVATVRAYGVLCICEAPTRREAWEGAVLLKMRRSWMANTAVWDGSAR